MIKTLYPVSWIEERAERRSAAEGAKAGGTNALWSAFTLW